MDDKKLKIGVIVFLVINLMFMGRFLGVIYFPGEITEKEEARREANALYQYIDNFAEDRNLKGKQQIKRLLADFSFMVDNEKEPDLLRNKAADFVQSIKYIYYSQKQHLEKDRILELLNQQQLPDEGYITFLNSGKEVLINESRDILSDDFKKELKAEIKQLSFLQSGEIKIDNGHAVWKPVVDIFGQLEKYANENRHLSAELQEIKQKAGFAPLEGPGIVVEIYDKEGRLEESGLVHDSDLKNIINEIKVAGAQGIEIGGQRLTAVSPVRCVGSSILVNNKPVAVNPVRIKAVGEPEVLTSGLDIVKKHFESFGLKLEITSKENIFLSGIEESQ